MKTSTLFVLSTAALSLALITGCAGGGAGSASASNEAAPGVGEGKQHTVSAAEESTAHGSTPLSGSYTKLWINGMGCPQCVSNIDLQLERQLDASDLRVDLESGIVYANFAKTRPSPDQIAKATEDAGLTLAKIESASTPFAR